MDVKGHQAVAYQQSCVRTDLSRLADLSIPWPWFRANSTDDALMALILPNLGIFKPLQAAFPWVHSVSVRMKQLPVEFD